MYEHRVDTCCPRGSKKDNRVSAAELQTFGCYEVNSGLLPQQQVLLTAGSSLKPTNFFNTTLTQTTRIISEETFYNVLLSFPIANRFLSTYFVAVSRLVFVFSLWPVKSGHSAALHTGLHSPSLFVLWFSFSCSILLTLPVKKYIFPLTPIL